ncbi:hypothetical protein AMECASPLE_024109 [Ameca splendens]|uniref:Uncharacterized protein n=1 Tax=Ameca splendens TaxID=208324 RepID=A0ABV0XHA8_9TELE
MEWYTRKDWLCGCSARNRIFCFPCLLFPTCGTVWTQAGFCDLKNLQRSLTKHERSIAHIQIQIARRLSSLAVISFETERLLKLKENKDLPESDGCFCTKGVARGFHL